jgi:hypothetical protein
VSGTVSSLGALPFQSFSKTARRARTDRGVLHDEPDLTTYVELRRPETLTSEKRLPSVADDDACVEAYAGQLQAAGDACRACPRCPGS